MKHRIALSLVLSTPVSVLAQSWFPPYPTPNEPEYVVYSDVCGDDAPVGTPVLSLVDAPNGRWRLDIEDDGIVEFCIPSPGSGRTYAFEIPDSITRGTLGPVPVRQIDVRRRYGALSLSERSTGQRRGSDSGERLASIAGTWTLAGRAEQGLLINMTSLSTPAAAVPQQAAAVGWTTYGADGSQRWLSGASLTPGVGEPSFSVELTDTGNGTFAGGTGSDAVRRWGRLDLTYLACGRMTMRWLPEPYTGLAAGEATLTQLTGSLSAPCDLAAYARERNGQVVFLDYRVE